MVVFIQYKYSVIPIKVPTVYDNPYTSALRKGTAEHTTCRADAIIDTFTNIRFLRYNEITVMDDAGYQFFHRWNFYYEPNISLRCGIPRYNVDTLPVLDDYVADDGI